MKVDLKKGDYRYDALQTLWTFFKEFGEPESNDDYWHNACEWASTHYGNDLEMRLLLTALNYLQEEVEK